MSVTIQIHGASPETYALVGGEEHTAETSRWKTLDIGETHVVIFAPREAEDAGLEEAA